MATAAAACVAASRASCEGRTLEARAAASRMNHWPEAPTLLAAEASVRHLGPTAPAAVLAPAAAVAVPQVEVGDVGPPALVSSAWLQYQPVGVAGSLHLPLHCAP